MVSSHGGFIAVMLSVLCSTSASPTRSLRAPELSSFSLAFLSAMALRLLFPGLPAGVDEPDGLEGWLDWRRTK